MTAATTITTAMQLLKAGDVGRCELVRAPDVAFVRASRTHLIPSRGFFPGAPDLAVEVLSPDDSAGEVLAGVNDWLSAGTQAVWVADPDRRSMAIHQPGAEPRVLADVQELEDERLLPGPCVKAADLFPP
jgi:Uma2 family endonuclease